MFHSSHESPNEIALRRKQERGRLRNDASYVGALSLALIFVMQYAFSFIVTLLIKFGAIPAENLKAPYLGLGNTMYMYLYMAVYICSLLWPALIVSYCCKKRFFPFTPAKPVPFGIAFFGVLSAIGLCMLSNIINSYILYFFTEMGLNVPEAPQTMVATPTSLALNLFTMAVLPALLEEMIYRGYILRVLRPYGNLFAVLISSALFSLMHGNLRQIPFAFIVGLVLGSLYVCTNNIWLPIAVHFANNAISVLMEYFAFSLPETYQGVFYALIIYGLIVVGIVCSIVLLAGYRKQLRVRRVGSSLRFFDRWGALFSSPLFVTAVLMYVMLLIMEA
ncbi:MAG: CPBP family intramembrane metalloprotease [Clostridia bacterium]|nr:CPBP family intramembrane metalloprotease [Clostridia bacterium]